MRKIIEGSKAVAEAVRLCRPAVVCAYPITPQTHIVEELAQFKADGVVDYEYIRAESEFGAASIVLGAAASGVRTYSATSSQGLLLMTEVIFNIAGMRLPVILTCANRAVSSPLSIWNDQQDAVTIRDSGWIMLFAETNQEAVDLHILAYKIAEQTKLPVMVNMDGFVLTHTFEPVDIPELKQVKKYLPDYNPAPDRYLNTKKPLSFGTFCDPSTYMEIRQQLQEDLINSKKIIQQEAVSFSKIFGRGDEGLIEYYGPKNAATILVAMGSVIGTIKDVADELNKARGTRHKALGIGILKIKCFRPFPDEEIIKVLSKAKNIGVIDKSISLGAEGILASEVKRACCGHISAPIHGFIMGLGGKDITKGTIKQAVSEMRQKRVCKSEFKCIID